MTKKDIQKAVLNKIKKKHIKPTPKWEFLLKKSALWGILGITVLLGAISSAIIIFMIESADFDLHEKLEPNFLSFLFKNLPYFWLALLVGFLFLAYYNFRHTPKGHRYDFKKIFGYTAVIAVLAGVVISAFGIAEKIEHKLLNKLPYYHEIEHQKQLDKWVSSDHGRLAGRIIEIEEDGEIEIEDFNGEEWDVIIENLEEKAPPLKEGMRIRIIGDKIDDDTFEAEIIRPWKRNFLEAGRGPRPGGKKGPGGKLKTPPPRP